jgi:hypothetical protein
LFALNTLIPSNAGFTITEAVGISDFDKVLLTQPLLVVRYVESC